MRVGRGGECPGHKSLKLPREFSSGPGEAENMDHVMPEMSAERDLEISRNFLAGRGN